LEAEEGGGSSREAVGTSLHPVTLRGCRYGRDDDGQRGDDVAEGRKGGGRDAFADLFEAHREDVVRLAYLLSGDAEMAKDAAAEAFVRTYQQWRRGKVDRVEAYVRRAVINAVKNDFRRRGRQRRFEGRRFGDGRGARAPSEHADASDEVWQLIRQLPQRQRTVVVLRYWEDQPLADIA
jgi:RNA polymerase sigma factor (sigma-70 family)